MTASNDKTGILCLLVFYAVSIGSSCVLASLYEVDGRKYGSYGAAVKALLGRHGKIWVTICQTLNIVCFCIAYSITASVSMKEISKRICSSSSGSCIEHTWALALIFGGIQLFCSQLPNLEEAWWMSAIGAAMSIGYSGIALGLCIAHAGNGHGTVGGIETSVPNKVFSIFNALGDIAFAFSFSAILLEIQDTLREPPKAVKTMKKVVHWSLGISFAFYLAISITGYLAFGNAVPGDVLTAFKGPSWLVALGNGMVVVHMVSAYQVYAQPLFVLVERELCVRWLKHKSPEHAKHSRATATKRVRFSPTAAGQQQGSDPAGIAGAWGAGSTIPAAKSIGRLYPPTEETSADIKLQLSPFESQSKLQGALPDESAMRKLESEEEGADVEQPPQLSPYLSKRHSSAELRPHTSPLALRLLWRSGFVAFTTLISCIMPFFSNFVGLIGGLMYWPLSIGFPLAMWLVVRKPSGWRKHGALAVAAVMLLVGIAATIGSARDIVVSLGEYQIFG
ncbi:hypothetical protein N2152v2_003198 [Parachlorella kessleri]